MVIKIVIAKKTYYDRDYNRSSACTSICKTSDCKFRVNCSRTAWKLKKQWSWMTLKICPNGLILLKHFTLQSKARNIVNDLIEKSLWKHFQDKEQFWELDEFTGLDKFGFSCTVMFFGMDNGLRSGFHTTIWWLLASYLKYFWALLNPRPLNDVIYFLLLARFSRILVPNKKVTLTNTLRPIEEDKSE